jgi:integrase/recombinase XerD
MRASLFDQTGLRKYLVAKERQAFVEAATRQNNAVFAFCITLAITGARISEVLALTSQRIDNENSAIVFETLKRREKGIFRAVPVPAGLILQLRELPLSPRARLWPWCRTTAWCVVKRVMREAGITEGLCKPKALRHAFAVEAGQNNVPLNVVQRWLGHARLETTAIYAGAIGEEERNLARRTWGQFEFTA